MPETPFLIKLKALGLACEFCEISKNTFFTGHLRTTAFEHFQNVFSSIVKTGDNNPSLASFGKLLCIHAILICHK